MPGKHTIKPNLPDAFYHVYNRGVAKSPLFLDRQDENVFLSYLQTYLLPRNVDILRQKLADPAISSREKERFINAMQLKNFSGQVEMVAYTLMPNHFHFCLLQHNSGKLEQFMRSLGTRFAMYFNRRYNRVGSLFQGVYRAVYIDRDEYLLTLSRYIHEQAKWHPSSYGDFIGSTRTPWVHSEHVLNMLAESFPGNTYEQFMRSAQDYSPIHYLLIEE